MPELSKQELAHLRREFVRKLGDVAVDFDKPVINAAFQAIEDWYETEKYKISIAIDVATTPYSFPPAAKKMLGAFWLLRKAFKEGV